MVEFRSLTGVHNTNIIASMFMMSDLIERDDFGTGSLMQARIADGSITPWGATKIIDHMLTQSPDYMDDLEKRREKLKSLTGFVLTTDQFVVRQTVDRHKQPLQNGPTLESPAQGDLVGVLQVDPDGEAAG